MTGGYSYQLVASVWTFLSIKSVSHVIAEKLPKVMIKYQQALTLIQTFLSLDTNDQWYTL
jgi:hypothetical protein